jgi:hypothetical protein
MDGLKEGKKLRFIIIIIIKFLAYLLMYNSQSLILFIYFISTTIL